MEPWEIWVRSTAVSAFVLEHSALWPVFEIVHYIGLSLLFGTVVLFDLRILGFAKIIPAAALHRLVPLGIGGYVLNLFTGLMFFSGFPEQYAYNRAFHFKLAFMSLAAVNLCIFYGAVFRQVRTLGAGQDAPRLAKIITGISLSAWVAVVVCGRLLTFYRPPFFH
jgi:hypothetical protein